MSIKLTDTQLVILSAAAQREDRCLTMPKSLKGNSAQRVSSKLLATGLVREIQAKQGAPVWRRDEDAETSYSLKLTAAEIKTIAVDVATDEEDIRPATPSAATANANLAATAGPTPTAAEIDNQAVLERSMASATAPREGTKMGGVVGLLEREHGGTLAELIAATEWLPHTVRAALTGLRKRGFVVTLDRSSKEHGSTYAITRDQISAGEAAEARTIEPPPALADRTKTSGRRTKSEPAALAAIGSAA